MALCSASLILEIYEPKTIWDFTDIFIAPDDWLIYSSIKSLYFNSGRENEFIMKRNWKTDGHLFASQAQNVFV